MKKVKILEIILAVMMIFAVTVMPSLADEPVEDVTITSSWIFSAGEFAESAPETGYVKVDSSQVYDAAMGKSVRRFYSSSYTNQNTAGKEPRFFLAGKKGPVSLGGIDYSANTYGYVRLTTDLYIDNATNGIALRFARYDSTTNELVGTTSTGSYYIGIGGSSFSAGSGVSYVCKDLVPRKWQRVVIEIGVDSTHKDVNFYVDDVKSATTFTLADTYGIGTKDGGNFSVFIPKGTKGNVYDVRISDFTIKATVSGYNPETSGFTGYNVNEPYVFNNDATLTRAEENNITVETVQAPQIDSEVYTKEVLHLSSNSFANGTGGYTEKTYANAGNLPIFSMVSKEGKLGGVDYSDYNYLRVRFNIFVNDSHNGVILKLSRYASDNSTVYLPDYVFGIGASNFSNISYKAGSVETYQCRQLTVGKWNDVLLELGVKANDATMRIYVNGEEKAISERENPTFGVNNGTGYCGASANRCGIIPKSGFDKPLDMYLSDVSVTVAKEAYDIESVVYPTVECASEDAVAYGSGIYTRDSSNITNEILTKVNANYAAVLTDLGRVVSYNDSYKTFKYYNIVTEGFITRINSADYSGEDTDVNAMIINVDGNINAAVLFVAYYKNTEDGPRLVKGDIFNEDISNLYNDINETSAKPEGDFDFVKVFMVRDLNKLRSIGRVQTY